MVWAIDSFRYAGVALVISAFAGSAYAQGTTTINGVVLPTGITAGGGVFQTGIISETSITGSGQTLKGVGRIDQIAGPGNVVVWQNGQNGVELAFAFNNYVSNVFNAPTSNTAGSITFTGGSLSFYTLAAGTNIDDSSKTIDQNIATVTSGTLFLGTSGSLEDSSADTLTETIPATGALPAITSASGSPTTQGFLDVNSGNSGGPAGLTLNTNSFSDVFDSANGGKADASFNAILSSSTPVNSAFAVTGTTSITANAVPEPASLGLLALGLVGLGVARSRR